MLIFLGTGCAEPSKYRGPSATWVQLPGGCCMLLDVGEGAFGQAARHWGPAAAQQKVSSVAAHEPQQCDLLSSSPQGGGAALTTSCRGECSPPVRY